MYRRFSLAAVLLTLPLIAHAADNVVEIDGLKSKAPAAWKEKKSDKPFRLKEFVIEKTGGDSENAELVIFNFPKSQGGGGTLEQNIARWKGQFKEPAGEKAKTDKYKVGKIEVTVVDVSGTYLQRERPQDPNSKTTEKPNYRSVNAYFPTTNQVYFFKLLGPAKTVEGQKKAFDEWLKNFK